MADEVQSAEKEVSQSRKISTNRYIEWQSVLPDEVALNDIALAGTHNSAACYFNILPGLRCQGVEIAEQLQNGIRFLDLRIGKLPGLRFASFEVLYAVHGYFSVKTAGKVRLLDILTCIYQFLDHHKSEFLVISLKEEGLGNWLKDEFAQLVMQHIQSEDYGRYWMKEDFTNAIPSIGKCRGRCILLRRFSSMFPFPLGIDATNWPYNSQLYQCSDMLCIQDFCEVKSKTTVLKKQEAIHQILKNSVQNRDHNKRVLCINFISSTGLLNPRYWPSNISKKMAKSIAKLTKCTKISGIIVLDFADFENFSLVHDIVMSNF